MLKGEKDDNNLSFIPILVESQKGIISVQRCSVENQKGATAMDFVQQ